jgi:hypothetical protein
MARLITADSTPDNDGDHPDVDFPPVHIQQLPPLPHPLYSYYYPQFSQSPQSKYPMITCKDSDIGRIYPEFADRHPKSDFSVREPFKP